MTTFNNDSLKNELASEFIRRNDPLNRWGNLVSSYLALPGLRGFWPMSAVGASGQAIDLALGNHLTNNGSADFSYTSFSATGGNFMPYCGYNGSSQYHSIADNSAHDIIGSEGTILSSAQGLTLGAWVQPLNLPGITTRVISKGTSTGNDRSYFIGQGSSNNFQFGISLDGGSTNFASASSSAFSSGSWYFVVGRFIPGISVRLYVYSSSGVEIVTDTTSVPATIHNSSAGLAIAAQADGTLFANVRVSMVFVCAMQLEDFFPFSLFEQGRTLFGI